MEFPWWKIHKIQPLLTSTPHLSKIRQKTNFTPQLFSASAVERGPEVISKYGLFNLHLGSLGG